MNLPLLLNASRICIPKLLKPARQKLENRTLLNRKYIHTTMCHYKVPKTLEEIKKDVKEMKKEKTVKVRTFMLEKYIDFLRQYVAAFNKRFPTPVKIYRMFTVGIQGFVSDVKAYMKIYRILSKANFDFTVLNRKEIEFYHQMPKDMLKVAPVLIFSMLPFANYILFPLIYAYPRQILTSHFWNLQQKAEFRSIYLTKRLKYNRPVFRCLQEQLDHLEDSKCHGDWKNILGMLGSGIQPDVEQIIKCKELFYEEPYHLFYLRPRHVRLLLQIHELHRGLFRRKRLLEYGLLICEMDKAIIREGGVHNLPLDDLKHCCYIRGLNPQNMRQSEMVNWLSDWIKLSSIINKDNVSLLLHAPILLGYNEPSNWSLIYSKP